MCGCGGSGDGQREQWFGADTTSRVYGFSRNLLVARTEGQIHLGMSVRVVPAVYSPVGPVHHTATAIEVLEGIPYNFHLDISQHWGFSQHVEATSG